MAEEAETEVTNVQAVRVISVVLEGVHSFRSRQDGWCRRARSVIKM